MTALYIKLTKVTELQTFWVNYLRDENTYIINSGIGNLKKTFDDIPDEHKNNCKTVTLDDNVYPINKEWFTYVKSRPRNNQKYTAKHNTTR